MKSETMKNNLWDKAVTPKDATPEATPTLAPVQAANDAPEAPTAPKRRTSKKGPLATLTLDDLVEDLPTPDTMVVRTYRVRADHDEWLRKAAYDLRTKRGIGKADASEVLRLLLDKAMGIKGGES